MRRHKYNAFGVCPCGARKVSAINGCTRASVTLAQQRVFENLKAGREPYDGLYGMAAMGGLDRTLRSMRRRGWLTPRGLLTEAGRNVCKQLGLT